MVKLPPPQSPPFFTREFGNESEYELAENGNEREDGANYFSPLPVFPHAPATARYSFEREIGDKADGEALLPRLG